MQTPQQIPPTNTGTPPIQNPPTPTPNVSSSTAPVQSLNGQSFDAAGNPSSTPSRNTYAFNIDPTTVKDPQGQQFLQAFNYYASNPSSPLASAFYKQVQAGTYNSQAQAAGIDLGAHTDIFKTGAEPNLLSRLETDTEGHAANIVEDLASKPSFTNALDVTGNIAGEAGDLIGEPLKSALSKVVPQNIQDDFTKGVQEIAGTPEAKAVVDAWNQLSAQHPDAAKNIGNVINIGALMAGGEGAEAGASAAKEGIESGVQGVKDAAGEVTDAVKGATTGNTTPEETVWDQIKPNLTPTEQVDAVKAGSIVKDGPLGTIKQIPQPGKLVDGVMQPSRDMQMIEVAKPYVLDANGNPVDPLQAVKNTTQGIADEATKVRSALENAPGTWSSKNLIGKLNGIDINDPDFINVKSDTVNANKFENFKNAIIKLADNTPKTQVGKLDLRQGFDDIVNRAFPKMWDKDSDMLPVVRAFRNTLNKFTEEGLPEGKLADGTTFQDALKNQTLLYDVRDNLASKVDKVGSNVITRGAAAIENHPIVSTVKAGMGVAKHFIP